MIDTEKIINKLQEDNPKLSRYKIENIVKEVTKKVEAQKND